MAIPVLLGRVRDARRMAIVMHLNGISAASALDAEATEKHDVNSPCLGTQLLQRWRSGPTSDQVILARHSCRASSTICMAASADNLPANLPTAPDDPAQLCRDSSRCFP